MSKKMKFKKELNTIMWSRI